MGLASLAKKIKQEIKEQNKSFEERFLETVDQYIVQSRGGEKHSLLAFHPSSFYKCGRAVYYELKEFPKREKIYARSQRILEVGTALHEWVQRKVFMQMDLLPDAPIKLIPLKELPPYGKEGIEFITNHAAPDMEIKFIDSRWTLKFPISGMVDGALHFMDRDFIFEFKTINPNDFEYLNAPLKEHLMQGALYCLCLNLPVMFVYFCKGTQNWKAFFQEYNSDQINWVKNRLGEIENCVLNSVLPLPEKDSRACNFCGYKFYCEKDIAIAA